MAYLTRAQILSAAGVGHQGDPDLHYLRLVLDDLSVLEFTTTLNSAINAFGLSTLEIAEKVGVNQQTVVQWTTGQNMPHLLTRQRLKKWFGTLLPVATAPVQNMKPVDFSNLAMPTVSPVSPVFPVLRVLRVPEIFSGGGKCPTTFADAYQPINDKIQSLEFRETATSDDIAEVPKAILASHEAILASHEASQEAIRASHKASHTVVRRGVFLTFVGVILTFVGVILTFVGVILKFY